MSERASVERAYELARQRYAELGVDTDAAIRALAGVAVSLHCWQGDDVGGFENAGEALGGGLAVTGNYPGKARTADELRSDIDTALSLIPGSHRLNLHAIYADGTGKKVGRDELGPEHFSRWIDWAKSRGVGLDFNPTCFAHPLASDGLTLSSADEGRRKFWVRHCIASRKIGAAMGKATGKTAVTNVWIPDGSKDTPADRRAPRERLERSLDEVFAEPLDKALNLDAVEGKLFGIGSESFVVGSHEFYFGYAIRKGKLVCLDSGHYHPTEVMADKISAVLCHLPEILLHVSRGVRWDSDHVVTLNDELLIIAREIVANGYLGRVKIGLDYFDASINRVAAWTIGTRNMLRALLVALLEPTAKLREAELSGDFTTRLALQEEIKTLPMGAVWDAYCQAKNVPVGQAWLSVVKKYESDVQSKRG
jgi:L-rhamnose isomerase